MDIGNPEVNAGGPTERWDAATRQLISERRETLSGNLKDVDIDLKTGRLIVQEVAEGELPSIVVRVTVSAPTEQEAKSLSEKEGKFTLSKSDTNLSLEDDSEGSFANVGGVVIGGNVIGGLVISGGNVTINGRRVTGNEGGKIAVPDKEVILKTPAAKEIAYNLRNSAGSIILDKASGRADLSTTSGELKIGEFTGDLRVDSMSGNLRLKHCKGELSGNLTSGDVKIEKLDGSINVSATSGDFSIREANFKGKANKIKATSGDVKIGVGNENLKVKITAMSGDIDVDRDSFTVTKESKPKGNSGMTVVSFGNNSVVSIGGGGGQKYLEGYYGQDVPDAPEFTIAVTSGDTEMDHR